jgi:glucose/arabinose dehydrogenase
MKRRALSTVIALSATIALPACGPEDADLAEESRPDEAGEIQLVDSALSVPSGFSTSRWSGGLNRPTAMQFAPDGRLFVTEQDGALRVISNGVLQAAPFLKVTVNSLTDRGLLGVAFDPSFASNRFFYVFYTAASPTIHNRVSRFTAGTNAAVPGSEKVLLQIGSLVVPYHDGGAIHFGRDGKLYVAVGDGVANGSADRTTIPQSLTTLKGKMLRLNSDGTVPADNPFLSRTTGQNRLIWALGLRNPFTFAFQPGTGRMFINDVGWRTWEEINEGKAGKNYGWGLVEGPGTDTRFTNPIVAYRHGTTSTTGCSIAGGTFYNPTKQLLPSTWTGQYFYADFCTGWVRALQPSTRATTLFGSGFSFPVDLKVGPDGALYVLERGANAVTRVAPQSASVLAAVAVSATQVNITWPANTESDLAGYKVYRNGVPVAAVPGSLTRYEDRSVLPATTYNYNVTAYDIAGNESVFSKTLTVTTPPVSTSTPTFSGNVFPILQAQCSGCHSAHSARSTSYAELTSMSTGSCSGRPRLVAGNAAGSLLYQKITGSQTCGGSMPPSGLMPSSQASIIGTWINQGAPNN